MRDPDGLAGATLRLLDRLRAAYAPAATPYPWRQEFVGLVRERAAARLKPQFGTTNACGLPDIETFAAGLRHELGELLVTLILPLEHELDQGTHHRLE